MKQQWFGCPNCYLAFSDHTDYARHFRSEHPRSKLRAASRLDSAAE